MARARALDGKPTTFIRGHRLQCRSETAEGRRSIGMLRGISRGHQ